MNPDSADKTARNPSPTRLRDAKASEGSAGTFLDYYGLDEQPFGVTPDPRFLYLGSKHREALCALDYGTNSSRGFLTLIAKPGMGKTSLLYQYLGGLRDKARTAFVFQTDGDARDFMRYLLADIGLDGNGKDLLEMRSMLNDMLLTEMRTGRRFVLVIDEAQDLDEKVLESIRLLSNFETPWMKLMQIVLAGQPELGDRLAQPSMAQLRQRISFAIRLEPLTREEVDGYIAHRLSVAGYRGSPVFSIGARALLAEHSEGIPRNINNICFCAMSFAWAMNQKQVDREMMHDVLVDLDLASSNENKNVSPSVPVKDEPKYTISQVPRPPILTVKDLSGYSRLTKLIIVSAVLFVLGWFAVELYVVRWPESSSRVISAPPNSTSGLTPAPTSLEPASLSEDDTSSTGAKKVPPVEQRPRLTQQDKAEQSSLARERN
jgi:type II secretory pathway predicted ATPase ExeA